MATAPYSQFYQGPSAPAQGAVAVVPDAPIVGTCRALYVGVGGNIALTAADGSTVTLVGVPSGCLLPLRVASVQAAGTTAASMVALY